MSTLTKQERDGLEDVFLSIHTNKQVGGLSSFVIANQISIVLSKLLKQAKIGLKKRKKVQFLSYFTGKKNYLSK